MICSPLGPQSGLLGLLLAAKFFHDPLVCLPAGLSTIFMTLACAPPAATRVASACPPYVSFTLSSLANRLNHGVLIFGAAQAGFGLVVYWGSVDRRQTC